jgi:hypothetical protein
LVFFAFAFTLAPYFLLACFLHAARLLFGFFAHAFSAFASFCARVRGFGFGGGGGTPGEVRLPDGPSAVASGVDSKGETPGWRQEFAHSAGDASSVKPPPSRAS